MKKSRKINYSTWLNIIILLGFTIRFLLAKNYEFLLYTFTIGLLIWLIHITNKKMNYSNLAKYGFSAWLFLHFAGGSFKIAGTRLYDFIIFNWIGEPLNILRYDQFIHAYCYFVIGLFVYALVKKIYKPGTNKIILALTAILTAEGVGAINEIIELSTVVLFGATGVGNYFNNALDLVFNLIGATIAIIFAMKQDKKLSRH